MKLMLPHLVDKIPHPFLIACEGYGDAVFFCALLEHMKIANCNVGCPSRAGGHGTGVEAISKYLQAVQSSIQLGKATLRGILVVPDADRNATTRFTEMSGYLTGAGFAAPSKAFSMEGNPLKSGVFIMPGDGKTGTLEHLLWEAAITKNPKLKKCVDKFCRCTGGHINSASSNAKAKMQVSAIVAAHCQGNPWASPAMIWHEKDNPIPIDSPCFKDIADFLVAFTTP